MELLDDEDEDSQKVRGPPIELEQAFPDRETSIFTLMDAIVSHAEEQHGIDGQRVTVEER